MRIKKTGLLYRGIIFLFGAFLLLVFALLGRELVDSSVVEREQDLPLLDEEQWAELSQTTQEDWSRHAECLFIYDQSVEGVTYRDALLPMLEQMKVACKEVTPEQFQARDLRGCATVVMCTPDLSLLGEGIWDIFDWVEDGGDLMITVFSGKNSYMDMIAGDLGIISVGRQPVQVSGLHFNRKFMIGSDRDYFITNPSNSSFRLVLDDQCDVILQSTGEDPIPLVWQRPVGDGTVVVSNLGYLNKTFWGLYASFYSLMGDAFAWPVINGSAFFLDDFPAPAPSGGDQYIQAGYGLSVGEFYQQVWWPDMQDLAEKYGLRYTGSVIEDYSNDTKAPFNENYNTSLFRYYGLNILKTGGEIGLHGYDHMPLVLDNFDYQDRYEAYVPWASVGDMEAGLSELIEFCSELYPNDTLQVYVPPSNILSREARAMLRERFPQVKVIASAFMPDDEYITYDQDFEVADDGIVEVPRIVSGYQMNDYIYISAFCELNFQYVNSHFQHPDDVMNEEQGAAMGWEAMKGRLDEYMDWIYTAAPGLRNMTASELAAAVQRYDAVTVRRTLKDGRLVLDLGNFTDEAWLLVRFNGHEPGAVEGGVLEKQAEGLYLLKAESDQVTIELD